MSRERMPSVANNYSLVAWMVRGGSYDVGSGQ
jgi:hypothetical protein